MAKSLNAGESAGSIPTSGSPPLSASDLHRAGKDPALLPSRRTPVPEVSDLVMAACQHPLKTLLLALVASAVFAAMAWVAMPPPYETTSLVRVRQREDFVFTAQQSRSEDAAFVLAQKEIAVEPQVLAAALQRPEMAAAAAHIPDDLPVDWLREHIQVENPRVSELMSISGLHTDPEVARVLCNAVTMAYLEEITARQRISREIKEAELERAARKADELLNEKWLQLHSVADEVGTSNTQSLTVRDQIQLQAYREYAQQLRAIQLQGNSLENRLGDEQLRVQQEQELSEGALENLLRSHPDVMAARKRLDEIEAEIREIKPLIPHQETPQMIRLRQERQMYVEDLAKIRKELEPQLRQRSLARLASDREHTLEQLKKQVELNKSEETFLRNMLAQLESEIVRTGDSNGIRLEMVRHAIERQERLADGLWQSLEQLKIESQAPPRISLITLAPLPKKPYRGRQLKATAAASSTAFVLVVLGIGFIEWRSCRVRHIEDVTARAQLPAFGFDCAGYESAALGFRPLRRKRLVSGAGEAASQLILQSAEGASVPTVAVSSATDSEPRDVVALELAVVLTDFGRRTLLIDADVDVRQLTRRMNAIGRPGLTDLPGERQPGRHVCSTTCDLLYFLPAGAGTREARHPCSQILHDVLAVVRNEYDAIIVNGTAMLGSAESVLLAARTDQTVLVAVRGVSRWDLLASARHRAEAAGLSVLGAVLHRGKSAVNAKQICIADSTPTSATPVHGEGADAGRTSDRTDSDAPSGGDVDAEDRLKDQIEELQLDLQHSSDGYSSNTDPEHSPKTSS